MRKYTVRTRTAAPVKAETSNYSKYLQYYPYTMVAVRQLRIDTGMNSTDALAVIEKLFGKVSRSKPTQPSYTHHNTSERQQKAKRVAKAAVKGAAITAAATGYCFLRVIAKLTKRYM